VDPDGSASSLRPVDGFIPHRSTLLCLSHATQPLFETAIERHRSGAGENALTLLVAPRAPPELSARNDGAVTAFLASGEWTKSLLDGQPRTAGQLCYHALSSALSQEHQPVTLAVVHATENLDVRVPEPGVCIEAIMPHRGRDDHLLVALRGLGSQTKRCRTIVCFDQRPDTELRKILANESDLGLFEVLPSPAGPYVPRQHFGLQSNADYVAFQDSDDFSISQRLGAMVAHAERNDADIVGCHELRLDEITGTVEAIRFPLDVNRALGLAAGHAQFFPTTIVRTEALRRIGGFSTVRRFGADRDFLLRAHWCSRILNLDAFLYIRRRRRGSLTTARLTSLRSPLRRWLSWRWKRAFAAVADGRASVAASALRVEHAHQRLMIRDLRTGTEGPASLRAAADGSEG
jgi:hypothetical protein